jgi:tetratricopeptide (TPR) repeat protein
MDSPSMEGAHTLGEKRAGLVEVVLTMSMRRILNSVVLLLLLGSTASAATSTVEMLRDMFRRPVTEWREVMKASRPLLTQDFFTNVEKRVRWGIENNHIDDAFRFAMVGDFGAEVKGQPANYRIDLADLFYKAGNQMMAGQIVDNILVTSPGTPAAKRASFLRAQLLEMRKELFAAHEAYLELAKSGHEPGLCWYKAGLISMAIQEETRGLEELKRAKDAGNVQAGVDYERYKAALSGDFTAIEPLENRQGIDTTTGVAPISSPDKTALLTSAQEAMDAGELEKARKNYQDLLNIDNKDPQITRGMAALLYRLGALEEALAFTDAALGRVPGDAELLRIRGNAAERTFDRTKDKSYLVRALQDYQEASKIAPNHQFLVLEYKRAQAKSL